MKLKRLATIFTAAGILVLLLSSALTYTSAHNKAEAFKVAHPELQGVSFSVVEVPLTTGGVGHLILDSRTGQPILGHYVLEFDKSGVLETTEHDARPKTLSSGYLDVTHVPRWAILFSIALLAAGLTLALVEYNRSFLKRA
jgi:hypothetical protein